MEDKLNQAHIEVQQLKASVKNYEGMIDNYKSQVGCPVPAALRGQQRLLLWREVHPKASPQKGVVFFFFFPTKTWLYPMLCWSAGDEDQTGG